MGLNVSVIERLTSEGILRQGHFAFRSGRHSNGLIDRDLLLADPAVASKFGYAIAKEFFTKHVETIATPSIWGAGLAHWIGYFLEPRAKVVGATPRTGELTIAEKLWPLITDRRVLLVDNLVISGDTMNTFLRILDALGATVVGIATLWDSAGPEVGGHPVYSLLNSHFPAWLPANCPLCAQDAGPAETVPY